MPVDIRKLLLDVYLLNLEVLDEQAPSNIEHLGSIKVHVNCKKLVCIFLSKLETAVVVIREVETVLKLCE